MYSNEKSMCTGVVSMRMVNAIRRNDEFHKYTQAFVWVRWRKCEKGVKVIVQKLLREHYNERDEYLGELYVELEAERVLLKKKKEKRCSEDC